MFLVSILSNFSVMDGLEAKSDGERTTGTVLVHLADSNMGGNVMVLGDESMDDLTLAVALSS